MNGMATRCRVSRRSARPMSKRLSPTIRTTFSRRAPEFLRTHMTSCKTSSLATSGTPIAISFHCQKGSTCSFPPMARCTISLSSAARSQTPSEKSASPSAKVKGIFRSGRLSRCLKSSAPLNSRNTGTPRRCLPYRSLPRSPPLRLAPDRGGPRPPQRNERFRLWFPSPQLGP